MKINTDLSGHLQIRSYTHLVFTFLSKYFGDLYEKKFKNKSTYEIVTLKGIFSGAGSFIVALIIGEKIPSIKYIAYILLLGFVVYDTIIRNKKER